MKKITFKNAVGDTIVVKEAFPYPCVSNNSEEEEEIKRYILQNIEGIGAPNVSPLVMRGFQQDGVSHYGNLLDARFISLTIAVQAKNKAELMELKKELFKVFNPALGMGVLTYTDAYKDEDLAEENQTIAVEYTINCYINEGPKELVQTGAKSVLTKTFGLVFLCPRPAWEIEKSSEEMIGFEGGVEFGLNLPEETIPLFMMLVDDENNGVTLGVQGDVRNIDYAGTLDAPLLIEFRGPAVLPKITKTNTGEYIEVAVELLSDEKLFIDTQPDAIDVYKIDAQGVRTTAFGYINPLSSYFMLTKGENNLRFSVSSGSPSVILHYKEQHVGV